MESIIDNDREHCFICHRFGITEEHHMLSGNSNRKISESLGLKIYICPFCHRDLHDKNRELELYVKRLAQIKYEETYGTRTDFIKQFGKSYL